MNFSRAAPVSVHRGQDRYVKVSTAEARNPPGPAWLTTRRDPPYSWVMPCYYGIARRPDATIGQVWVEAGGGRLIRQSWTGVTYASDREAGEDIGRLNQQTPIPTPGGPLEEIDLAACIRRTLRS